MGGAGVLAGLLVALVAAELVVRARYPVLNLRRDFSPGIYVEDPARGYANLPRYAGVFQTYFEDVPVRTNSLGFRGPEPPADADADATLRVLCLGDSNMFGQGVRDDEALPAQLERLLQGRGPAVCYNAGVSGYSTDHELRTLRVFGPRLRPRVVVLGWLDNDLVPTPTFVGGGHLVERAEDRDRVAGTLERRWYEPSYLARLVSITARTLKHQARTADRARPRADAQEVELARSVALVQEVRREAEALGAALWVIAYVGQPAVERGLRDPLVDEFLRRARASGVRCLDAYEPLRAEHERSGAPLYAPRDRVHPNALGHRVVAAALADALVAAPATGRE
jgi:lysophospholipase L1-like esterase